MLFYVIILGFGALAGVIINILINQKDIVYTVIGSIVILLTGGFACFVLYYPFYFESFRSMITTLVIVAVFFIVIYIALRLLVNAVSLRNEPLAQLDTGSGSHSSKQPGNMHISRTGTNGRVKTKTIGTVEVTRLNKTTLQNAKNAGPTAVIQPPSGNVSAARSAQTDTTQQTESAYSAFKSVPIPGEKHNAQQPGTASSSADDRAVYTAEELVQQPEAITASTEIEAEYISPELTVQMPETAAAAQSDEKFVEIPQELTIQIPVTAVAAQSAEKSTEIAQELPVQLPNTADAAQTVEKSTEIAQGLPVQLPETADAAQTVDEPAETVQEPPVRQAETGTASVQEPVADKYSMLLDKAVELIKEYKYTYAVQLLTACLNGPSSLTQKKQADILLLECLALSEQYDQARKKWLEVLNKMYILEPTDKLKLKHILIKIDSRNRQVS